jgi:hypothetical protein
MPVDRDVIALINDRLVQLNYVVGLAYSDAQKRAPAFDRWMEGSANALVKVGFTREAQRLYDEVGAGHTLDGCIDRARAVLGSLIDQIESDPDSFGLTRFSASETSSPPAPQSPAARVPWTWLPIAFAAGVVGGIYGRGPASAAFNAAQRWLQTVLARALNALTPGPPLPVPTWVTTAAYWILVATLGVGAGLLINLTSDDVHRDGYSALWRSPRCRLQLVAAVILSTLFAVMTAR